MSEKKYITPERINKFNIYTQNMWGKKTKRTKQQKS